MSSIITHTKDMAIKKKTGPFISHAHIEYNLIRDLSWGGIGMKEKNIIVFDVDNTLIKGNLTLIFLRNLSKQNWNLGKDLGIEAIKLFLFLLIKFPKAIFLTFSKKPNFYFLSYKATKYIRKIYTDIFRILKNHGFNNSKLQRQAFKILNKDLLEKKLHLESIDKLKHHIKNQHNIIVLLSGSMQEVLNVLFHQIRHQFRKDGINTKENFLVIGTQLNEETQNIEPCIGPNKIMLLKEKLKNLGADNSKIKFVYSDNALMIDLPLFIESQNGGAVISDKNKMYEKLPEKIKNVLKFLPGWKK